MAKLLFPELEGAEVVEARILKKSPKMLTVIFGLSEIAGSLRRSSDLFAWAIERSDKEVHLVRDALSEELAPGDHCFLAVAQHFIGNSCVYRGSTRYQMLRPKNFIEAFSGPSISYRPHLPNRWLDRQAQRLGGTQTAQGWVFPSHVSVLAQRLVDIMESRLVSVEIEAKSDISCHVYPVTFMGYQVLGPCRLDPNNLDICPGVSITAGTLQPAKRGKSRKVAQGSRLCLEVPEALLALDSENLEINWKIVATGKRGKPKGDIHGTIASNHT